MNVRVAKDLIRVLLIGGGQGGLSILKELSLLDNVQVLGLADLNPQAPGAAEAKRRGLPVWGDFHPMLRLKDYDVVVEATGVPDIHLEIEREKRPDSVLIVAEAALLMMRLIERHEELRDIKRDVIRLSAIMDAAQEGIQMAESYYCGTYCCNQVLYNGLYHRDKFFPNMLAGFLHVPYFPELVIGRKSAPSMPREKSARALEILLEECVEALR